MIVGAHQRFRAIGAGLAALALVLGFMALALVSLLSQAQGSLGLGLDAYTLSILRFTLLQALLSTLLSLLLALPLALALIRQPRFFGRRWLLRLLALPMGLPALIGALGLIGIWGRNGLVNSALLALGKDTPVSIYGLTGILIAHAFFNMPMAARLMLAGLERVPAEDWRLAASLGLSRLSLFRRVEWPVIRGLIPGIAGLIFMLCVTSFTLVLTLGGGPAATTLEVAIYQALRFDFDPPRAVSLAAVQLALTAVLLALLTLVPAPPDEGQTVGRRLRRIDSEGLAARVVDGMVLIAATLFIAAPLVQVLVAGLEADLPCLLADPAVRRALATSLGIALPAALCAVCLSLLLIGAHRELARPMHPPTSDRFVWTGRVRAAVTGGLRWLIEATASLVLLVPAIVLATGWFLWLRSLGLAQDFAAPVVIAINALMALPFTMRVLAPAVASHRRRTARLAASLGIAGHARLYRIDWPGLRRPLLMALSFAMALSLGDLGAVALFGADQLATLPWLLYSRLGSYRIADADGLALLLGLVCLLLTAIGTAGDRTGENDR